MAVVADIHAAWAQVENLATLVDLEIDKPAVNRNTHLVFKLQMDGYDLMMVQALNRFGIEAGYIDDGDYATVPNIRLFTSNRSVIAAAGKPSKLLRALRTATSTVCANARNCRIPLRNSPFFGLKVPLWDCGGRCQGVELKDR